MNKEIAIYKLAAQHAKKIDKRIPFYIFDIESFYEHVDLVREKLGVNKLVFAIKANPFLTGISEKHVDFFEVCSSGELEVCIAENVDLKKVVYTGLLKTYEDIEFALDSDVGYISVESAEHLHFIKQYCEKYCDTKPKKNISVVLRCASDRFGMEESQIEEIISNRFLYEKLGIHFVSLQLFTGTQKKIEKTLEEYEWLENFADKLLDNTGWKADFLEFGAGLKIPYFTNQQDFEIYEELEQLSKLLEKSKYQVHVELGRYITASCGYYFTTVLDKKTNEGVNYAILNGGIGHITYYQSNMGLRIPLIDHVVNESVIPDDNESENKWTLCGPICTSMDTVAKNVPLKDLRNGDYLVFKLAGAYGMTWSSFLFLSRPLPEICFYKGNSLKVVRESVKGSEINTARL